MIKIFQNIKLNNLIKRNQINSALQFVNFNNIKQLIILVDEDDVNKNELDKFISKLNFNVTIVFINSKAKEAKFKDYQSITKQDVNWLLMPKKQIEGNYDVLINCCKIDNVCAIALSIQTNSKLKCAFFDFKTVFNLILNPKNNLIEMLNEMEHYLKMIKN